MRFRKFVDGEFGKVYFSKLVRAKEKNIKPFSLRGLGGFDFPP